MHSLRLELILALAACFFSSSAMAQTVYKCGSTYSQFPCPDGVVINADPRSSAQKAQADQATARDARTASAMEKARLLQEKADLAANTPKAPAKAASASKKHKSDAKKKKKPVTEKPGLKDASPP